MNNMIDEDLMNLVTTSSMKTGANWGTGMLIVHPVTRKLLLGMRSDTKNWCSPGGKVEIGESPLQGVIRETKEESNIKVRGAKFYSYEMHTAQNGKNWTSFMFLTDDFDDSNIEAQKTEIDGEWGWFSLEEALQMDLFPPTRKSIDRAIDEGLLSIDIQSDDISTYIPYIECPVSSTSASIAHDSCCCAYSYHKSDEVFSNPTGMPIWD